MAENAVQTVLNKLGIEDTGRYDNRFYIIDLEDSNAYAKMYTKLSKNAICTESRILGINSIF